MPSQVNHLPSTRPITFSQRKPLPIFQELSQSPPEEHPQSLYHPSAAMPGQPRHFGDSITAHNLHSSASTCLPAVTCISTSFHLEFKRLGQDVLGSPGGCLEQATIILSLKSHPSAGPRGQAGERTNSSPKVSPYCRSSLRSVTSSTHFPGRNGAVPYGLFADGSGRGFTVAFDVESIGDSRRRQRIIQIAAVRLDAQEARIGQTSFGLPTSGAGSRSVGTSFFTSIMISDDQLGRRWLDW